MTDDKDPTGEAEAELEATEEVVDGLPVLAADARVLEPVAPVVQTRTAVALAATGFVAGAATVAIVHRRAAKVPKRRKKRRAPVGEILTSNSFLVDVHLLRRD